MTGARALFNVPYLFGSVVAVVWQKADKRQHLRVYTGRHDIRKINVNRRVNAQSNWSTQSETVLMTHGNIGKARSAVQCSNEICTSDVFPPLRRRDAHLLMRARWLQRAGAADKYDASTLLNDVGSQGA